MICPERARQQMIAVPAIFLRSCVTSLREALIKWSAPDLRGCAVSHWETNRKRSGLCRGFVDNGRRVQAREDGVLN